MGDITQLLHEWRAGDHVAENKLFDMVMPDLRKLAHHLMRGERANHTMQATELVDQVYFRLVAAKNRLSRQIRLARAHKLVDTQFEMAPGETVVALSINDEGQNPPTRTFGFNTYIQVQ